MTITIVTSNGESVAAPAERWLCGLITLLSPADLQKLCVLVAARIELEAKPGHVISAPGIVCSEALGRV